MDEHTMQQYMSKSTRGTGYLFRRGVPADVRPIIGKREFKTTLGGDFRSASQRCRQLAVETDELISAARAQLSTHPGVSGPIQPSNTPAPSPLTVLREVTPDFLERLRSTVVEQVLQAHRKERRRSEYAIDPLTKLREVERVRPWVWLARSGDRRAAQGWRDMLAGTLARNGYGLAPDLQNTEMERELLVEYASAYGHALDLLEADYTGSATVARHPTAPLLQTAPNRAPAPDTLRLSKAVQEFLAHLAPAKRAMNEKHGFILPAFLEVVGDMPVVELRQSHINDFLRTIQKLPPRWSDLRRKTGQNIRELASGQWTETLSLGTYEGAYVASLRTFLERAKRDWQDVGFPTTLTASLPYTGTAALDSPL